MQEAGDGINAVLRVWNVRWDNIHGVTGTTPTLLALNTFFETQAGYKKFLWTQPPPFNTEGQKLFVCPSWGWVYQGGLIIGFRATFEQRPF
jgi:phage-related protein